MRRDGFLWGIPERGWRLDYRLREEGEKAHRLKAEEDLKARAALAVEEP